MYGLQQIKEVIISVDEINIIHDDKLEHKLRLYLKYVYNDLGQVPQQEDVNYLVSQMIVIIRNKFKHLRVAEIGMAFRNGAHGVYGEYFGINVVSLTKFLKDYSASSERCEAVKQVRTEQRPERLLKEKEFDGMLRVKQLYSEFKEKGSCEDLLNLAYDHLDSMGDIDFSPEEKQEFMIRAEINIRKKIDTTKARDIQEFRIFAKALAEIEEGKRGDSLVVEAKKIALNEHFKRKEYL